MKKKQQKSHKRSTPNITSILNNISIDKNINIRQAYDDAMKYEMNYTPVQIREDKAYRILVNNIRHKHTNYDKNLKNVYHIKNNMYYNVYKNQVLSGISDKYPYLLNECNKQKIITVEIQHGTITKVDPLVNKCSNVSLLKNDTKYIFGFGKNQINNYLF